MKKSIIVMMLGCYKDVFSAQEMNFFMNVRQKLTQHWLALPYIQKILLASLCGVMIIWILWRLIKCGKGGCGCSCGPVCKCTL